MSGSYVVLRVATGALLISGLAYSFGAWKRVRSARRSREDYTSFLRRTFVLPGKATPTPAPAHWPRLRLLRYALPHWRSLLVIAAATAASIGLSLVGPWPTKILVDYVLGTRAPPHALRGLLSALPGPSTKQYLLLWVTVATVLAFLAKTLIEMVQSYVGTAVRERMTYGLGADLFLHLQRLSLRFHSRRPVGDSIARVTGDPSCVPSIVLDAAFPVLQSFVLLATMFAIMWRLQPTLTLISLSVVPFIALSIRVFGLRMKQRARARRDLEGRMMSIVQDTLTAIPAVQAFARENLEYERFRRYAADTVTAAKRASFSGLMFTLFVGLSTAIGTAAVFFFGGRLVLDGRMTIGTLLVFLAYLTALYDPLNTIAYASQTVSYAFAQADRVRELLDTPIEVIDAPSSRDADMRGVIRYEDVCFGYEPGRPVLEDISLEARPGEVIAIVGPTGAGKTTLVNLLIRFFDPWSGRITIDGEDLRNFRCASIREQVALVLQDPFIFPYTVRENIVYGRAGASRDEIEAAASAANAAEFVRRLPSGYETVIGERGTTLSGGEKQRLSIARAFLKDAPVLILDEPTSALDAATEALVLEALERLMKGRITFVVAHRLSTIRDASRILVLSEGRVVEQGTHAELLEQNAFFAQLYRRQLDFADHEADGPFGAYAGLGDLDA
jgi:ATP-binding cassette, subfamily B, bacterial